MNGQRLPYSYSILRYVHDVASGEFVNMGVVMFCPEAGFFRASMRKTYTRITGFFPNAAGDRLKQALKQIERALNEHGRSLERYKTASLLDSPPADALQGALCVLPRDDSSFQWSALGTGLTKDAAATLDHLFERFVHRYDAPTKKAARSDDQVWKAFCKALEVRNLATHLREHEIPATVDSVKFDHAIKNGKWHCLEPVSFDLLEAQSIRDKAQRLLGQMALLETAPQNFKVYFLVGRPHSADTMKAYDTALQMLQLSKVPIEIFDESQSEQFVDKLQAEFAASHPVH